MLSVFLIANWRCSSSFLGAVSRLADAFNDRRGFDVIQAKEKAMADVIVVIGPGQIGQAIARRVGVGKHVLLADMMQDNADADRIRCERYYG
jgi:phosphoglycerate dehydrogenase-like enzyme